MLTILLALSVSGSIGFQGLIVSNEFYATEVQTTTVPLDPEKYPKLYDFYQRQSQ